MAAVSAAARTSLAVVPGGHNFSPGCTCLVAYNMFIVRIAWRRHPIFTTSEFHPAQLNARHLAENMRTKHSLSVREQHSNKVVKML